MGVEYESETMNLNVQMFPTKTFLFSSREQQHLPDSSNCSRVTNCIRWSPHTDNQLKFQSLFSSNEIKSTKFFITINLPKKTPEN